MSKKSRRHIARKHIDKKLLFRLRLFILITLVMLGFVTWDILQQTIGVELALVGIVIGITVGFLAGRMFAILWHEDTNKVVVRLDRIGVIILIAYILLAIGRRWVLGMWLQGPVLTAFSLSIIAGTMFGRLLSMGLQIRKVLRQQGIL